jgi:toxin ParE1/3/4
MSSSPGMAAYLVKITLRAERDLEHLYAEINAAGSDVARKWCEGLKRQVLTLEKLPNRCPVTSEKKTVRHLLYGRRPHVCRVIFRLIERRKLVDVLLIRHGGGRGSELLI